MKSDEQCNSIIVFLQIIIMCNLLKKFGYNNDRGLIKNLYLIQLNLMGL